MPLYEIEHVCPITPDQQQAIASAIVKIHSEMFTTPSLFVNVRFKDTDAFPLFVAGQRRRVNWIMAHVRHGPSRTQEHYASVCTAVASAWASIVGTTPEFELRGIFVLGDIVAGWEAGFPIPQAGQDKVWLKHYVGEFKKLADAGDVDFAGMVHELETRKDLRDILAH